MNRNAIIALLAVVIIAAAGIGAYTMLSSPEPDSFKDMKDLKAGDYVEADVTTVENGKTENVKFRLEIVEVQDGIITFKETTGTFTSTHSMDAEMFESVYYKTIALSDADRKTLDEESDHTTWETKDTSFGKKKVVTYRADIFGGHVEATVSDGGNAVYEYRFSDSTSSVSTVLTATNMFI